MYTRTHTLARLPARRQAPRTLASSCTHTRMPAYLHTRTLVHVLTHAHTPSPARPQAGPSHPRWFVPAHLCTHTCTPAHSCTHAHPCLPAHTLARLPACPPAGSSHPHWFVHAHPYTRTSTHSCMHSRRHTRAHMPTCMQPTRIARLITR